MQSLNKSMLFFPLQKRCLGVFIKKLRNIVSNVTVREESIVRGIKAHLRDMEEHEDAVQQRNQVIWHDLLTDSELWLVTIHQLHHYGLHRDMT